MLYIGNVKRVLRVSVPATSANLGAGFDVLGLALDLRNVFTVEQADETKIEMSGYAECLPLDETNLFYRAFTFLHERIGRKTPPVHIKIDVRIPPGKGLGSSATAVVGGLIAANTLLGNPFDDEALLEESVKLEHGGHADNVAAALKGGLVVNVTNDHRVISVSVPFPEEIKAVLYIPDFTMDTVQGRTLMPGSYPKADVVFNISRVALFLAALAARQFDLIGVAMQDRLHQPYRTEMFPPMPTLIQAALDAGAHGASLSGGGSSVLALATERFSEIGEAMLKAGRTAGLKGEVLVLDIDPNGADAQWIEEEGEE